MYKAKGAQCAMANINYYRREAERCRKLAAETENVLLIDQWRKLARDYETLADDLVARPIVQFTPMQQQPVQQQQSKLARDDEN
jgi:hypothetical protein